MHNRMNKLAVIATLLWVGCTSNNARKHYVLAEKLWGEGNYTAAVTEFEKVAQLDQKGKLGLQAIFRAAMTQSLFTHQYQDAVDKFQIYIRDAEVGPATTSAKKQIGDIYYSKMRQYDFAIKHYKALLRSEGTSLGEDAPETLYRIAKSNFNLKRFSDALISYQNLIDQYPSSSWVEKATFERAETIMTLGAQKSEYYSKAIDAFRAFIKKYPDSPLAVEAQFNIATSFEEQDKLDLATELYESIKAKYPTPHVIEIKLTRIKQRQSKKSNQPSN